MTTTPIDTHDKTTKDFEALFIEYFGDINAEPDIAGLIKLSKDPRLQQIMTDDYQAMLDFIKEL